MSQDGVCWESRGKRRSTSVTYTVTSNPNLSGRSLLWGPWKGNKHQRRQYCWHSNPNESGWSLLGEPWKEKKHQYYLYCYLSMSRKSGRRSFHWEPWKSKKHQRHQSGCDSNPNKSGRRFLWGPRKDDKHQFRHMSYQLNPNVSGNSFLWSISLRGNKTTTLIDCEESLFCSKICERLRYDVGVCERRSRECWRQHNSLLTASPHV